MVIPTNEEAFIARHTCRLALTAVRGQTSKGTGTLEGTLRHLSACAESAYL
jgi:hypothetical protein